MSVTPRSMIIRDVVAVVLKEFPLTYDPHAQFFDLVNAVCVRFVNAGQPQLAPTSTEVLDALREDCPDMYRATVGMLIEECADARREDDEACREHEEYDMKSCSLEDDDEEDEAPALLGMDAAAERLRLLWRVLDFSYYYTTPIDYAATERRVFEEPAQVDEGYSEMDVAELLRDLLEDGSMFEFMMRRVVRLRR